MEFDELIGALFGLYILLSILSGVLRGVRGRGPGPGREAGPEVLDMEELERRLREAQILEPEEAPRPGRRAPETAPAPAPAPSAAPPVAQRRPAAPGAPTPEPARTTLRPPSVGPSTLRPGWASAAEDDWDAAFDLEDADWAALEAEEPLRRPLPAAAEPRPAEKEAAPAALPAPIQAMVDQGHPWQAAFALKELLGPPRALAPYRVWPRD